MDRRTVLRAGLGLAGLSLLGACDTLSTAPSPLGGQIAPVAFRDEFGAFVANSYADVAEVLRGEGWSNDIKNNVGLLNAVGGVDGLPPVLRKMALFSDAPGHTRLRTLIAPAVSREAVELFRPRVSAIVDQAIGTVSGDTDILATLGYPIQIAVTAELHDLGPAGAELIRREVPRLSGMLELGAPVPVLRDAMAAVNAITAFLAPIVAQRAAAPGRDLLSTFLSAERGGDRLDHEEVIATFILLLLGQETVAHLIGNGMLALLENPDQLDRLRRQPDLVAPAVREIMRFYGPVKISGRIAVTDKQIGGQHIKAGHPLLLDIAGANRDPSRFADPDKFDIARDQGSHVGFGSGPHVCLGMNLAHLQVEETLTRLLARFPTIRLAGGPTWQPTWRPSTAFRSVDALPVTLSR